MTFIQSAHRPSFGIACILGLAFALASLTAQAEQVVRPDAGEPGDREPSTCLAVAQKAPTLRFASLTAPGLQDINLSRHEVEISFVGHSTFRITSAEGVVIATDFAGFAGRDVIPTVVTMNRAHSSHYTNFLDPEIDYVLPGWVDDDGSPASYHLAIKDVLIRNVTTDVRSSFSGSGGLKPSDNSIFIFEVAGLCIGHLGHLHHELSDEHIAAIGRLDVLMVPVDGSFTLNQASMARVVQRLRTSLILPMHYFGQSTLRSFLTELGTFADIVIDEDATTTVSLNSLPSKPTVLVLPGY